MVVVLNEGAPPSMSSNPGASLLHSTWPRAAWAHSPLCVCAGICVPCSHRRHADARGAARLPRAAHGQVVAARRDRVRRRDPEDVRRRRRPLEPARPAHAGTAAALAAPSGTQQAPPTRVSERLRPTIPRPCSAPPQASSQRRTCARSSRATPSHEPSVHLSNRISAVSRPISHGKL